jgi:hypothetical protein
MRDGLVEIFQASPSCRKGFQAEERRFMRRSSSVSPHVNLIRTPPFSEIMGEMSFILMCEFRLLNSVCCC